MPDYRLEALSTRSFEQLVQSLALEVVSSGVVPFGDGPDGGREATFDGITVYPDPTHAWHGYGVIQAKFLQKPKDADSDGKWALKELSAELSEYEKQDTERTIP